MNALNYAPDGMTSGLFTSALAPCQQSVLPPSQATWTEVPPSAPPPITTGRIAGQGIGPGYGFHPERISGLCAS